MNRGRGRAMLNFPCANHPDPNQASAGLDGLLRKVCGWMNCLTERTVWHQHRPHWRGAIDRRIPFSENETRDTDISVAKGTLENVIRRGRTPRHRTQTKFAKRLVMDFPTVGALIGVIVGVLIAVYRYRTRSRNNRDKD